MRLHAPGRVEALALFRSWRRLTLAEPAAVGRDLSDDIWCADFTTSATASDLHCDFACPERPERPRRFGCPNLCSYKR